MISRFQSNGTPYTARRQFWTPVPTEGILCFPNVDTMRFLGNWERAEPSFQSPGTVRRRIECHFQNVRTLMEKFFDIEPVADKHVVRPACPLSIDPNFGVRVEAFRDKVDGAEFRE